MKRVLNIAKFSGGMAGSEKEGVANSFKYTKNMDLRSNPTKAKLNPRTVKDSGATVTDLILDSVRVPNGDTFFIGDTGNFYKRTAAGVWSLIGSVGANSGGSIIYRDDTDTIYITKQNDIAVYRPVSGTPALTASFLAQSKDQFYEAGGASTYALTVNITENDAQRQNFTPEIEPLYSVKVWVIAKGTGNWTLTVHDAANNVIASKTIANASLTNGALNEFVFATPGRVLVKPNARTYHIHLTSTVADGTAQTYLLSIGAATISNATPAVVTKATHGLAIGDAIYFTTTDTLPAPLAVNTTYYVISSGFTSGDFQISTVPGGNAINTTSAGAGTHTLLRQPKLTYETYGQRLATTNNGLHPMIQFMQYCLIGNGRYVSVWEPLSEAPLNTEYLHNKLVLPPGYEVCGFTLVDEFVAIAAEKKSTNADSNYQDGKIFFWDGTAGTYNLYKDIADGSPHGIFAKDSIAYWNSKGEIFACTVTGLPQKIRRLPNIDGEYTSRRDNTMCYPNVMTVRKGVILMGFPSYTNNLLIEHGVYGYGAVDKNYPPAFSFDYTISTGTLLNTSGNVRIGMVKNFNEDLFISWRDGNDYGVDIVNNSSKPATTASLESLIFDNQGGWKQKTAIKFEVGFESLPTGCTLTPKYKIDRGAWVNGTTAIAASTEAEISFPAGRRWKEIEFGFDVATDANAVTSPGITNIAFHFDDQMEEKRI